MAQSVSKAEGVEVFAHTKLVTGRGITEEEAIAKTKANARTAGLRGYVRSGSMGPDRCWLTHTYMCHIIFAEESWWKTRKET